MILTEKIEELKGVTFYGGKSAVINPNIRDETIVKNVYWMPKDL